MSRSIFLDYIKNGTYFQMCLSPIWITINTSFQLSVLLCFIIYKTTLVKVSYSPIWASRPRIRRICPRVLFKVKVLPIFTYTRLQFDLSLTHKFNLTVLQCFNIYKASQPSTWPSLPFEPIGRLATVVRVYFSWWHK